MTDANSWLMNTGTPSAKFPKIGTVVTGTILETPKITQQTDFKTGELKYYSDGNPMQQLVVRIETELQDGPDDDGVRSLYVKGQMKNAVRDAVKEAGAPGLEVGGQIAVRYAADGEPEGGGSPPKIYQARYTAPTADTAAANDFLGAAPAAAPAQPADPWGAPAQPPAPAPTPPAPAPPPTAAPPVVAAGGQPIDLNNLPPEVLQMLQSLQK